MQSFSLLPPILENKLDAVKWIDDPHWPSATTGGVPTPEYLTHIVPIKFTLPIYTEFDDIGHFQISIKEKSTNNIAIDPTCTPDQQVIYIDNRLNNYNNIIYDEDTRLCTLNVPMVCFYESNLKWDTLYNIQVRFGEQGLWYTEGEEEGTYATGRNNGTLVGCNPDMKNIASYHIDRFSAWRNYQVTNSLFGEWSNVATLYCYLKAELEISSLDIGSFIPHCVVTYSPSGDDPLKQVAVNYFYENMYGLVTKNMVFNSRAQETGGYTVQFDIPVAPVMPIKVVVEGFTQNNVWLSAMDTITPNWQNIGFRNETGGYIYRNTSVSEAPLYNPLIFVNNTKQLPVEEQEDGVLSFYFDGPSSSQLGITSGVYNVYRVNIYSLEIVQVIVDEPWQQGIRHSFKDFSPEVGEEYEYIVMLSNATHTVNQLLINPADPWGWKNPGYARLMRMESLFLSSKKHQLRLLGNVKLGSYKRNTQDQFQTTIGSRYPFYSRSAETNYRTFILEGLISIEFDPTSTFLYNDVNNGLRWNTENNDKLILLDDGNLVPDESRLIVLNRDLYSTVEHSMNRRRVNPDRLAVKALDKVDPSDVSGPKSIFGDYLSRDIQKINSTSYSDEMIYVERKFRDFVMAWLSDGKPKLFRSETEGNMIVMLTGINFTPYDASHRMVYQMSATVTEIAEYNATNLLEYDLIPVDIRTQMLGFPSHLSVGDIISAADYQTLIHYLPGSRFFFSDQIDIGVKYKFHKLPAITGSYKTYWETADWPYTKQEQAEIVALFSGAEKENAIKYFSDLSWETTTLGPQAIELDATNPINEFLQQINKYNVMLGARDEDNVESIIQGGQVHDMIRSEGNYQAVEFTTNLSTKQMKYTIVDSGWPIYAYPYLSVLTAANIGQESELFAFSLSRGRKKLQSLMEEYNKYLESDDYKNLISQPVNRNFYDYNAAYAELLDQHPSLLDLWQYNYDSQVRFTYVTDQISVLQQQIEELMALPYSTENARKIAELEGQVLGYQMESATLTEYLPVVRALIAEIESDMFGPTAQESLDLVHGKVVFKDANNNPVTFSHLDTETDYFFDVDESVVAASHIIQDCYPGEVYTLKRGATEDVALYDRLFCIVGSDGKIKQMIEDPTGVQIQTTTWEITERGWIILSIKATDNFTLTRSRATDLTKRNLWDQIETVIYGFEPRGWEFTEWLALVPDSTSGAYDDLPDIHSFILEGPIIPENGILFYCDGSQYNFFEDTLPYGIDNSEFPERTVTLMLTDLRPETNGKVELVYVKVPAILNPND